MAIEEKLDCVYFAKKLAPEVGITKGIGRRIAFIMLYPVLKLGAMIYCSQFSQEEQLYDELGDAQLEYRLSREKEDFDKHCKGLGLKENEILAYQLAKTMDLYMRISEITDKETFENALEIAIDESEKRINDLYFRNWEKIKVNKDNIFALCCAEVYAREELQFLDNIEIRKGFVVSKVKRELDNWAKPKKAVIEEINESEEVSMDKYLFERWRRWKA